MPTVQYNLTVISSGISNPSGALTAADIANSGFLTASVVTASGYEKHSDILASGYLKRSDLIGSGYVTSINGAKNSITLVGSGGTTIWADGQTIQIYAPAGGGPPDLTASGFATYSILHTSGYIRNVDFVTSGFITKAEVALSGFATITQLQVSGYTTLSEVRNDIRASGYESHSDILASGYLRRSDLIGSGYIASANGLKNSITLVGSGGMAIWSDGQTIQIASTVTAFDPISDPYILGII